MLESDCIRLDAPVSLQGIQLESGVLAIELDLPVPFPGVHLIKANLTIRPQHHLASRDRCMQSASKSIQITIRNVPEDVPDKLASRAALPHQSMQEYLRGELERIASRPSVETWLEAVRERKAADGTRVPAKKILNARDQDRK